MKFDEEKFDKYCEENLIEARHLKNFVYEIWHKCLEAHSEPEPEPVRIQEGDFVTVFTVKGEYCYAGCAKVFQGSAWKTEDGVMLSPTFGHRCFISPVGDWKSKNDNTIFQSPICPRNIEIAESYCREVTE